MYISDNGKFKEGIIWWDSEIDRKADVDIFFYIHDYKKRADNSYGFKTLEINLSQRKIEIENGFSGNLRNELRKTTQIGYEIEFIETLSKEQVEDYVDKYNSFAAFKKIQKTSIELITQMVNERKIFVSIAKINGEVLNIHSHYVSEGRARLYHSFSVMNNQVKSVVSLANKYLTCKDIFNFKDKGLDIYDFGGIGNVEGDNSRFKGIIEFKRKFGGVEKILWKGTTLNGERGEAVYEKYFTQK